MGINIYLFTDGESFVKIGKTKDVDKRLENLQVGNPKELYLIDIIENVPDSFENHMHSVCRCYRIKGEWFKISVLDHIQKQEPLKSLFKNNLESIRRRKKSN